ncbi:MAG TPA: sigma-70 family RNA polymerase sigma factor [Thermoleophilia bacterium]|nr:sigma-70 family RNA polymerase sigma factor [Thermoleophilia bacterium]
MSDLDNEVIGLMGWVRSAARKYRRTALGYEDAVAVGNLALVEAARSYDRRSGAPFEAWAVSKVRWALSEACRNTRGKKGHIGADVPVEDALLVGVSHDNHHSFHDALMHLRPRVRETALLAASGWSHREIAARYGVSEGRISQLMSEARRNIIAELGLAT